MSWGTSSGRRRGGRRARAESFGSGGDSGRYGGGMVDTTTPGSVGEFLLKLASKQERKNYYKLVKMLEHFEKKVGLSQRRPVGFAPGDGMTLQLGSMLKATVRFSTS